MLVMRRRAGEGFLIGEDIEIEVLEVGPTRVKLGVKAPKSVEIVRSEVIPTRDENVVAARPASVEAITWLSRALAGRKPQDGK
jgi:carbon storage regulator